MGNNMIAKVVIFFMMINLASGIMLSGVVDINGIPVFDSTSQGGYDFDGEQYSDVFVDGLSESVKPEGWIDDAGDQIYRVLDTLSLGFVYKFIYMLDNYMYGFINMLDNIIGQHLEEDVRVIIFGNENNDDLIPNKFGIFKTIVTISYIIFGIRLYTGKDVVETR